jgi:hypothetical protein
MQPLPAMPPHTYATPQGARIAYCKSCGVPIAFVQTPKGASVPVSLLTLTQVNGTWVAKSHYLDCPQASGWGKR